MAYIQGKQNGKSSPFVPMGGIWANRNSPSGDLRCLVFWLLARRVGDEDLPEELMKRVTGNSVIAIIIAYSSIADDHGTMLHHDCSVIQPEALKFVLEFLGELL